MTISILLVDDHILFRKGVRALLEATTEFCIVGEAGDGLQALALAERLHPDVVVLDYMLLGMSGREVMRSLHTHLPETLVAILSLHDEEYYVLNSIMYGASGYILKEDVSAHLALAVGAVASGLFYFSPILRERIVLSELGHPTGRPSAGCRPHPLAAEIRPAQAAIELAGGGRS
jgi:two-component system response regulator NreC